MNWMNCLASQCEMPLPVAIALGGLGVVCIIMIIKICMSNDGNHQGCNGL